MHTKVCRLWLLRTGEFFFFYTFTQASPRSHESFDSNVTGPGKWHKCPLHDCPWILPSLVYLDLHQKLEHLGYDPALCGLSRYQESPGSFTSFMGNNSTTLANDTMPMTYSASLNDTLPGNYNMDSLLSTSTPGLPQGNSVADIALGSTSTPPNARNNMNRVTCTLCNKVYARTADLNRHFRTHDPNAKKHGCPAPGCKYAGNNGFPRRDKLRDHVRARHPGMTI